MMAEKHNIKLVEDPKVPGEYFVKIIKENIDDEMFFSDKILKEKKK